MSTSLKHAAVALAAAVVFVAGAAAAQAATTVDVTLWDKGGDTPMVTGLEYPHQDMSKATMGIKAAPAAVPAGEVTFKVTNISKDEEHEMIVMYLADPGKPLPYIQNENRVDEDKAGDKGEVSELEPGASGALTVNLKPGHYLLICNVPGHYVSGMWTTFTVK